MQTCTKTTFQRTQICIYGNHVTYKLMDGEEEQI